MGALRAYGKPPKGEVVEREEILATPYPTVDEIRAKLIARGLPVDHLIPEKLIKYDDER